MESVALVDFNELTKEMEQWLGSKVHYIVDHHVDNQLYLDTLIKKEIQLVGSATTLVIQNIFGKPDILSGQSDADLADLSLFLSAPISLDSYNFNQQLYQSKWTDLDKSTF